MELYKAEFGEDYPLGVPIPDYFEDQSYRNDAGPSFVYVQGSKLLKIWVLPQEPSLRDIEDANRYTLVEMLISEGDYHEYVNTRFATDSPEGFKKIIFDKKLLDGWLNI